MSDLTFDYLAGLLGKARTLMADPAISIEWRVAYEEAGELLEGFLSEHDQPDDPSHPVTPGGIVAVFTDNDLDFYWLAAAIAADS